MRIKGEEKFLTRAQKQLDANMAKWREQQAEFNLKQRKVSAACDGIMG